MSKAKIKTADAENNSYTVDVPGYGTGLPAQGVTKDELSSGSDVNIVDHYNKSPDDALTWGNIRLLPNTGEYIYSTDKIWKTADELWTMDCPASLAYGFMFSSERNKKWQDGCPLYKIGTVTEIVDEKYMNVRISDIGTLKCRTDYMTCDTVAFAEKDVVVVKFEDSDRNKPVVVGFWDEPKSCGFQLKLTRGDGTLITEASGLLIFINLYNSNNVSLSITTPEYNVDTEYCSFNLLNSGDADPDGYWVNYFCTDGIGTQYPYKYKSADKYKNANLISLGIYEDTIPYWKTESSYVDIITGSQETCPDVPYDPTQMGGGYFVMAPSASWGKRYNVKSSVPYQIWRRARNNTSPGESNINDHFFFSIDFISTCCNPGSGCKNSGNTTTGNIDSALITGGGLNVSVTGNNEFNVLDEEIIEGSIEGNNHDITLNNNTPLTVSNNCIKSGACSLEGSYVGNLRSLSGTLSLINIGVKYDY